jgi:hypothetical protein
LLAVTGYVPVNVRVPGWPKTKVTEREVTAPARAFAKGHQIVTVRIFFQLRVKVEWMLVVNG